MAQISIEEIQNHVDTLKDWVKENDSSAKECLVIKFKKGYNEPAFDEDRVREVLEVESRNGHVTISFDASGLLESIEIS